MNHADGTVQRSRPAATAWNDIDLIVDVQVTGDTLVFAKRLPLGTVNFSLVTEEGMVLLDAVCGWR